MNWSKFFIAFIVAFVFVFFFGFVWHGILMKSAYMEIASHYRPDDQMGWPSMILGHVVIAFFFTWIIASFGGGARMGVLIGMLFMGLYFIRYAVEPLSPKVVLLGSIGEVLMYAIAGVIIGALYKPKAVAM